MLANWNYLEATSVALWLWAGGVSALAGASLHRGVRKDHGCVPRSRASYVLGAHYSLAVFCLGVAIARILWVTHVGEYQRPIWGPVWAFVQSGLAVSIALICSALDSIWDNAQVRLQLSSTPVLTPLGRVLLAVLCVAAALSVEILTRSL